MDIRTSKVEASAMLGESSKAIGPGSFVDLDEPFANGTLRDVFPEEFFESAAVNTTTDAPADTEPLARLRGRKRENV